MNPFDPAGFLSDVGLYGLMALLFIETGLLIGFIFPGDSVLFTAGIFSARPEPFASLWQLLVFLPIAAMVGDQCGYLIGRTLGPRLIRGRVIRFIGTENVARTTGFFDRYGPFTVLFARFIGIVRTLVPVLAGYSGMNYRLFTLFSVIGSILWCDLLVVLGYYLGSVPLFRDHLELLMLGSAATIIIPIGLSLWQRRRRFRQLALADAAAEAEIEAVTGAATATGTTGPVSDLEPARHSR